MRLPVFPDSSCAVHFRGAADPLDTASRVCAFQPGHSICSVSVVRARGEYRDTGANTGLGAGVGPGEDPGADLRAGPGADPWVDQGWVQGWTLGPTRSGSRDRALGGPELGPGPALGGSRGRCRGGSTGVQGREKRCFQGLIQGMVQGEIQRHEPDSLQLWRNFSLLVGFRPHSSKTAKLLLSVSGHSAFEIVQLCQNAEQAASTAETRGACRAPAGSLLPVSAPG